MPTLVIASIECCKTAGDCNWTSSMSGMTDASSWPIGRAETCVPLLPSQIRV